MTNEDIISFTPDTSYVIPGRIVKQLMQAVQHPEYTSTPLDRFLEALDSMGVTYNSENCCGNTAIHQVWFDLPGGWELLCEFSTETGEFIGFYVEG